MKRKQKQPELCPEGRDHWVVNLTERNLTPNQQEVLRMGLNFAPVPTKFPLQDTIASVEEAARQLPKNDLRGCVCRILRSARLPKDNMKKEHQKTLKELRSLEDEVILPADKGNATVVMKRSDYDERYHHLQEATEGSHCYIGSRDRSYTTEQQSNVDLSSSG